MTVKGIVEIGGKRTKAAKEDIRKLKNSLDELSIMHIVDDVMFCKAASRMDRIADAGIYYGKNECNVSLENGPRKNGPFEFRELIIPYFYIIDYVSLIQLNDEEAELLENLLHGSNK